MSQKKKVSRTTGKSTIRSGSTRTGSRKGKSSKKVSSRSAAKPTARQSSSKKSSSKKAAAKKTNARAATGGAKNSGGRTRTAPTQKRATTETAPTLGKPPRRKAAAPSADTPASSPTDDAQFAEPYPVNPLDVDMLGIGSPLFPPGGFNDPSSSEGDSEGHGSTEPWADDPSVEMRIREIEERLDGLMASEPHEDLDLGSAPEADAVAPTTADTAVDAAREVLENDYYRKKWGRTSLRERTNEVDDFGMDPDYEEKLRPALDFLFKKYFRVEVEGIRNVPAEGRAVLVANHSGALPLDGVMLREAIRQRHSGRADMRWLAEDFSFYLPFLGVTLNRIGAVRACPENAERLLAKEHLVGVFPEGAEGTKKLYKNRYRLQRFGRGGFVRLCLKTQSPMIPCAIIGAEETNPILYRFDNLSKLIGLDYLPITPTFPLLGPLGLVPAPTKWKIVFGEPISVAEYGPQAAQDHVLVGRLAERMRSAIGDLMETALRRRKSVWL